MEDGSPNLEVGFAIGMGGSFEQLRQLETAMGTTEAKVIADVARVEKALGGMVSLERPTADIIAFGNAATRELREVAREKLAAEKAGERLVGQLERENAAFGKSRAEMRQMRVEQAALAAERVGNTDLANRLRAQELDLYGKEMFAARQSAIVRTNAAEDAAAAEVAALRAVNKQLADRERLEALLERNFSVGRAPATQGGATFSALAERERALELTERQTAAQREQLNVQRQQIGLLAERANIEAALERNTGVGRVSATDAGATYSALAAKAAEDEARALGIATAAAKRHADEHQRLAAAVRGSHAAQLADAEAAERLRMSTDPLYAATSRLNAEIAESTRLYRAGAIAPTEYARQQQVLTGRLNEAAQAHDRMAISGRRNGHTMTQLSFQLNDVATMAAMGAPPFQIFASQIGQIIQVAQMAEGGVKGFATELGALLIRLAPFAIVLGTAAAGFALFSRSVSSGIDTKAMVNDLGLTRAEIKRLKDVSVDTGDVVKATFQVIAKSIGFNMGEAGKSFGTALNWMTDVGRNALATLYANFVGTFKAIGSIIRDVFSGKGLAEIVKNAKGQWDGAYNDANAGMKRFGANVRAQIAANKKADLERQAAEIKADRTPTKPKVDRHAEQLERDARAVEAQIRNLYLLAEAYDVSGAAALIAEARVKAESQAIRRRADIEAAVARQIRLAVAERVSNAAKSSAAMRDQAAAQAFVNKAVQDGEVPAALANQMLQDRLADLPLLAAQEAARHAKDQEGLRLATDALDRQRDARLALNDAEAEGRRLAAMEAGRDQIAMLEREISLIGATEAARVRSLASLRAEQEARRNGWFGDKGLDYVRDQVDIADTQHQLRLHTDAANASLRHQADMYDAIASNASDAARGMADAFGAAGQALGDMAAIFSSHLADQQRLNDWRKAEKDKIRDITDAKIRARREDELGQQFAVRSATRQIGMLGDMTSAAKGFFDEKSKGYAAITAAEKIFRAIEFALSVRAMAQDAAETVSSIAKSGARAAAHAVEAVAKAIASLPFPANIAAGAATVAALASIGLSLGGAFGGGGRRPEPANEGRGTVFGDPEAQSQSIRRSIDALREVDTLMLSQSRDMAASLKSIDSQIAGFTSIILRAGNIDASAGVREGFQSDTTGKLLEGIVTGGGLLSKIPLVGGIVGGIGSLIGSLFGSKTTVVGNGLYGGPQSVGSILGGGFDASYYSDVEKQKRFLGIKTGTSYSTRYSAADSALENQFTLILRSFNDAIASAAGPLGLATADIQHRLSGFVVNIGKIDLKGLTGEQVQEKLSAIFGAAADGMAAAAMPGLERFQRVGEGAFETLVRVASTVEAVTSSLDMLGGQTVRLGMDAKLGLADQFESLGAMSSAVEAYFDRFYSQEEQAAAKTAQLAQVFGSLGMVMPGTLAGFRQLVDAQDLNTAAGREAYATLLQLAPAFADLKAAMDGAKSAADILSERQDLERRLLQVRGDTAALRAVDLAKLDASNRALQQQIWAIEDAQEAARAAEELRDAWKSVGDTILDEVKRIRGLDAENGQRGFATLMGQFNAANSAARAGDIDAAKSLPGLSQALLSAAADAATSRQELARVQALTAASLQTTYDAIGGGLVQAGKRPTTDADLLAGAAATKPTDAAPANDSLVAEVRSLREEVTRLREQNNAGHAATAGNTASIKKHLDNVTAPSGGDALSVAAA